MPGEEIVSRKPAPSGAAGGLPWEQPLDAGHSHRHVGADTTAEPAGRAEHRRRLRAALVVTAAFLILEIAGGLLSGSLALLADAAHMFTDVGALLLAYAAMTVADRAPTRKYTFGLYRAEILAAFVNAELLLLISGYIFYEAYGRFLQPREISTGLMLWVAAAGLGANVLSMVFLHRHHEDSLNLKAAYLEVLSDAFGSIAVITAALVMALTGWYWIDPLISAGIGILILPRTWSLLKQSAHILLEGTPAKLDIESLRQQIAELPGVEEIHDLHCWTLTSGLHAASVHIRASRDSPRGQVLKRVQSLLRESAGMDHATIQVEWGAEGPCEMARGHE